MSGDRDLSNLTSRYATSSERRITCDQPICLAAAAHVIERGDMTCYACKAHWPHLLRSVQSAPTSTAAQLALAAAEVGAWTMRRDTLIRQMWAEEATLRAIAAAADLSAFGVQYLLRRPEQET